MPSSRRQTSSTRWRLIEDEETKHLQYEWDMSAPDDCDKLFKRVRDGKALEEDWVLFDASMIDRFITRVFASEPVEPWIMNALAKSFCKVMAGGEWNDEFRLPGRPTTPVRSVKDQRDLELYCDIRNAIRAPNMEVTSAIKAAASKRSVSYETARAAYYQWKGKLAP